MAEPRREIEIRVFGKSGGDRILHHVEKGRKRKVSTEDRVWKDLLVKVEGRQHLGRDLRDTVIMDQEGIDCLVEPAETQRRAEKSPFDKDSEHSWRMGI